MSRQVKKIVFKSKGFHELLNSPEIWQAVTSEAKAVASRAGPGFEASVKRGAYGGGRPVATVRAETAEANRAESENKALTRAIRGGA